MAVKLTTPVIKYEENFLGVKEIIISIPHEYDDIKDAMKISANQFQMRADYGIYDLTGNKVDKHTAMISWGELPQTGKDMIKNLYSWLENKGIADGIIGDGTQTDPETGDPVP